MFSANAEVQTLQMQTARCSSRPGAAAGTRWTHVLELLVVPGSKPSNVHFLWKTKLSGQKNQILMVLGPNLDWPNLASIWVPFTLQVLDDDPDSFQNVVEQLSSQGAEPVLR